MYKIYKMSNLVKSTYLNNKSCWIICIHNAILSLEVQQNSNLKKIVKDKKKDQSFWVEILIKALSHLFLSQLRFSGSISSYINLDLVLKIKSPFFVEGKQTSSSIPLVQKRGFFLSIQENFEFFIPIKKNITQININLKAE